MKHPFPAAPSSPVVSPIDRNLQHLHDKYARLEDGNVATYIPELGRANPDWFGIAVATVDGQVYEVGDSRQAFTIQSISKPFVYGLALEAHGLKKVMTRVGVEPSGEAFNSISLDPASGRPFNPMINAGAIATTGLVPGQTSGERFERILTAFAALAGRGLEVDESVYHSERETGHRNRAIAHLLRNFNMLAGDPEVPLDCYFRQCAIAVTCRDLAIMAATLAGGGVNPITGQRVLKPFNVGRVLTVMSSCGMYDFAGEWMYSVGMPAKSGVAGGILAVLPGQLGLGVFSPPLDRKGNSVRGIRVCSELSRDFGLHLLNTPRIVTSVLRGAHSGAEVRSKRQRTEPELECLRSRGHQVRIFQFFGRLVFASVELALRKILDEVAGVSCLIFDFERVLSLDRAACRLLLEVRDALSSGNTRVYLTGIHDQAELHDYVANHLGEGAWEDLTCHRTADEALEAAENDILLRAGIAIASPVEVPLERQELCRGMTPAELRELGLRLETARYQDGAVLASAGAPADSMFFIARGEVGVFVPSTGGEDGLVLKLGPGMSVGELTLVDRQPRSATVRALTPVKALVLPFARFDQLAGDGLAHLQARLLANLSRVLAGRLRSAIAEISSLK